MTADAFVAATNFAIRSFAGGSDDGACDASGAARIVVRVAAATNRAGNVRRVLTSIETLLGANGNLSAPVSTHEEIWSSAMAGEARQICSFGTLLTAWPTSFNPSDRS